MSGSRFFSTSEGGESTVVAASAVENELPAPRLQPDFVLLDDDPLIHLMWQVSGAERGKNVLFFSNAQEFFSIVPSLPLDTPVYIDANLGNGVRGEDVILALWKQGFTQIYLATGYSGDTFPSLPKDVQVVGKEPPWETLGFPT